MKTEKTINLTAYVVEYIDQREPKPRTVCTQTVVLGDPARRAHVQPGQCADLAAIQHHGLGADGAGLRLPLDMRPAGWIAQQFERDGYTVASIHKGETITAHVDLADLWQQTAAQIERDRLKIQLQAALEELNSQGVEV